MVGIMNPRKESNLGYKLILFLNTIACLYDYFCYIYHKLI